MRTLLDNNRKGNGEGEREKEDLQIISSVKKVIYATQITQTPFNYKSRSAELLRDDDRHQHIPSLLCISI